MAIAKTNTSLAPAATAVGAAASVNATEWDMSALFSGLVAGKITNGASAPTTLPIIVFYAGESTGVKREIWRMGGDTVANSATPIVCSVPKEVKFLNVTVTGGATNGSTFELMGLGFTGP
jgi:hypothetical protein